MQAAVDMSKSMSARPVWRSEWAAHLNLVGTSTSGVKNLLDHLVADARSWADVWACPGKPPGEYCRCQEDRLEQAVKLCRARMASEEGPWKAVVVVIEAGDAWGLDQAQVADLMQYGGSVGVHVVVVRHSARWRAEPSCWAEAATVQVGEVSKDAAMLLWRGNEPPPEEQVCLGGRVVAVRYEGGVLGA